MEPNQGTRPNISNQRPNVISLGNDTLNKFLGGGFLNSTLNLFEREGPSSRPLDSIWNKSFAATTLASGCTLILVDFNSISGSNLSKAHMGLPSRRKVKAELLYKDICGNSRNSHIKIAWRYVNRNLSPADITDKLEQLDFGLPMFKDIDPLHEVPGRTFIINVKEGSTRQDILTEIDHHINQAKKLFKDSPINVVIRNILHPFSPVKGPYQQTMLVDLMYSLRCLARKLERGAFLVSYDRSLCDNHSQIKQYLYNIADSVVSFHSYETDENVLSGYKNADGTLQYIKVPKVNSFGLHFQQDLSDWGYRLTKNHRYFMVDELSLPPADDETIDNRARKQTAADLTKIGQHRGPMEQVAPLEEFKEVAKNVIAKDL